MKFRTGIGVGEITTEFSSNVLEMDGSTFHRSKSALEIAEKDNHRIWVQSGNNQIDTMVNTALILLYALKSRWTDHQKEIIHLRQQGMTYKEISERKGISKQAVNKTLKAAHWAEVSFAIHTLNQVTNTYFEQLEDNE